LRSDSEVRRRGGESIGTLSSAHHPSEQSTLPREYRHIADGESELTFDESAGAVRVHNGNFFWKT